MQDRFEKLLNASEEEKLKYRLLTLERRGKLHVFPVMSVDRFLFRGEFRPNRGMELVSGGLIDPTGIILSIQNLSNNYYLIIGDVFRFSYTVNFPNS